MIPSVISSQIERGIKDFLRTTFPPSTPFFEGILERLFEERDHLFKGPYISAKLPFRQGTLSRDYFESFAMKHTPFLHQERAFQRLTADSGRSTLISTGTGSGKTECFLYPVLDYCYRHRGERGIKAIIIYPMNALANDQAKRMARLIAEDDNLKGNVTAGLFVGHDKPGEGQMMMTDQMIITQHDTLRAFPPDILLTNYKMLDYLLIRPVDLPLWQHNASETLKYLVVDEIHTFDGAQGTDLACLLRRLKARLKAPKNHVCCVGTSATLGADDNANDLRAYAEEIFDESFDGDAVITEDRVTAAEFLGTPSEETSTAIEPDRASSLSPDNYDTWEEFLRKQAEIWFGEASDDLANPAWTVALGERLRSHTFFRNLVRVLGNKALALDVIGEDLRKIDPMLAEAEASFIQQLTESLLGLVSIAKRRDEHGHLLPFLDVRVQVWMRELRRVVAEVNRNASLRFSDDLKPEQLENHLPLIHCRECGAMGWGAVKHKHKNEFSHDLQAFYSAFFGYSPTLHFVFPEAIAKGPHEGFRNYICGRCLHAGVGEIPESCPSCGSSDTLFPAYVLNDRVKKGSRVLSTHTCPFCESQESLTIVGSRSASLLSVVIGQLFNTTYYNDPQRKLLTFSDSVQDASHRAGFFESRTFRFSLRTAIQHVVQAQTEPLLLSDLAKQFRTYWGNRLDDPSYVSAFLAPDMAWFEDYESLRETGKLPTESRLLADTDSRIAWEILSEYGFRARIGRTLEKTGCSIATPDTAKLDRAITQITEQLANEIGGWRALEPSDVAVFLQGLLSHLRTKGAIDGIAPLNYMSQWGNSYAFKLVNWLPNLGQRSRTPAFLTTKRGTRFENLLASGTSPTWYQDWLERALGLRNQNLGIYADAAYAIALKDLVDEGFLDRDDSLSHPVWGIQTDALRVEQQVDQLQCDHCGVTTSAAESARANWDGMPCLRFNCPGHYRLRPPKEDYYGRLYSTGEVHRIFAGEHTGLLKREVREEIERRFIQQDLPASENLLSCTPTLEMGIDIGDLSSVLLCSIPPSQANYLQRIGRSGRRDGNAFNFAMAEGRPHDLYFFYEPTEMLAGHVEPPGVFLNAPAVLERQLVGFCFDRWIESGIKVTDLPRKINQVLANLARKDAEERFPHNWFRFVDTHRTELLEAFYALFEGSLTDASRDSLRSFMEGQDTDEGSLSYRVLNRLRGLLEERDSLRRRVRQISRTLKLKKESKAKDLNTANEIADLGRDKALLNGIIRRITSKDTFNFFTDEGLLPNYAFPEAGVLLRSIIYRSKKTPDEHGKYDTRVFEYQRPAATAIHELAPANTFYAEGRKVTIDRINIEMSEPEEWRFCDACSHSVREIQNTHKASCPKCGSPLWADEGQRRRMLRLTQVEATTSDWKSRVDDASDSREPQFYCKHMLVEVDPAHIDKAFRIDSNDVPFGFEFLSRADFREVNFGEQTIGEDLIVAGQLVPAQGFKICSSCGRVASEKGEFKHALTCRYYGKSTDKPLLDALYLYREFSSEAVRMLLPASSSHPVRLQSFVAAFYLGLQRVYKGSIEHLQTTIMDEPIEGSSSRKQYLVLYDRVPGGTGYLKDLMESETKVFDVLEQALHVLTHCDCMTDPDKDGCYHCLYAYRNSRDMPEISRAEAVEILTEILEHRDHVIPVDSVGSISVNTLLDSELEKRFIEALRRSKPGGEPARLQKDIVHGKPGWRLDLSQRSYAIVPQVELGAPDGIAIPSRADFVFYPEKQGDGHPVAVFTDGFLYHADISAGNLRVGEDLAQRMAIVRSGSFLTWSLSWEDVESQFRRPSADYFANYTNDNPATMTKLLDAYHEEHGTKVLAICSKANSFEALLTFLHNPDLKLWKIYAFLHAINGKKDCVGLATEAWVNEALEALQQPEGWNAITLPKLPEQTDGSLYVKAVTHADEVDRPAVSVLVSVPRDGVKDPTQPQFLRVLARLFDDADIATATEEFKCSWNGFLRLYNFIQFLPLSRFVTTSGIAQNLYDGLDAPMGDLGKPSDKADENIELLILLTDAMVHDLIRAVAGADRALPEAGYELLGESNEVVATAELAWPDEKIALLIGPMHTASERFRSQGWEVIDFEPDNESIREVLSRLPSSEAEVQ
ncbi:DEAD/DEAH box helicase [Candidatus Bipolaricaulota bacterium]|nr:DEAD/DEAH box helicase [Candidatus Bipolaricaulota bacterium]